MFKELQLAFRFRHDLLLSGILSFFLMLDSSFAQETKYESALLIPWSSLTQAIVQQVSSDDSLLDFSIDSQRVVVSEIPVQLSQIHIQVNGQVQHLGSSFQNLEEVKWAGDPLRVGIEVGSFEVSKVVEQMINGIRVRAHLSARCQSIYMEQTSAKLDVGLSWVSSGASLESRVSSLDLSWPIDSWKIGPISCQGPRGFADVVEQQLRDQLSDPVRWIPLIKSEMESHLNQAVDQALARYRNPTSVYSDSQTQLKLQLSGAEALTQKGLVLKGFLTTPHQPEGEVKVISLDLESILSDVQTSNPILLVPGRELATIASQVIANREVQYNLRSIPNFENLMKFRLFQFFVWPDLMNYSKTSSFPVISRLGENPKASFENHRLKISGSAQSWVYSHREGRDWRYVDVETRFSVDVLPRIERGQLKLDFEKRSMQSSYKMTKEYVEAFHPSSYLPLSLLNVALEKSPTFQNFEIEIPKIKLEGGLEYSAYRVHYFLKDFYIIEMQAQN